MPTLTDLLDAIWRTPNRQMAWGRIQANHVVGAQAPATFVANNDYVVVKLSSMYLKNSRILWLKLSPLAHATVTLNGLKAPQSQTAVIGPAQFGDLSAAPTERSVVLRQRLAGPAVWRGGDLQVAAGLFAVPKDQAAGALMDTLGQLAALAVPGLKQGTEIARVVKSGVEGLIGLNGTKPVLGVKDALGDPTTAAAGTSAAPCILVAIAAPQTEVDLARLWVREARLWEGTSADALTIYERNDYLLVEIERGPARQDWRGLPSFTPHEAEFDTVLRAADLTQDAAAAQLNKVFAAFDADLISESDLTDPDKDRIRGEVIVELKARLARKYAGPFAEGAMEKRSVGGITHEVDPEGFNFLDVGDTAPESARPAKPGQRPFNAP
jgi:hypothetical protein